MKLSVLNGLPSEVGPMQGTPAEVAPMQGFYPESIVIQDVINGCDMCESDAAAYRLAVLMGDQDAVNGLEDPEALDGWREKRKERQQERKDRKAHSVGAGRRASRRAERDARRKRREEKHERKMKGEGGSFWDKAGDLALKLTGGAQDAVEDLYSEGIDPDPDMVDQMDRSGAFKDKGGSGSSDKKEDNSMMWLLGLGAVAAAAYAMKGK